MIPFVENISNTPRGSVQGLKRPTNRSSTWWPGMADGQMAKESILTEFRGRKGRQIWWPISP
jgi:hypothetical protein